MLAALSSASRQRIFSFSAVRRNVPRARSISDAFNLGIERVEIDVNRGVKGGERVVKGEGVRERGVNGEGVRERERERSEG